MFKILDLSISLRQIYSSLLFREPFFPEFFFASSTSWEESVEFHEKSARKSMCGAICLFIKAAKKLVLKTQGKRMIPVVFKLFFYQSITKKYIKPLSQILRRFGKSFKGFFHFRIDVFESWNHLVSEEISRNSYIFIGFVETIWNIVIVCILKNLFFWDREEWTEIVSCRKTLDAYEACDAGSFCDSVEECFSLIICVMSCDNQFCCVFFSDCFEPFFSNISRTFFDGGFCFFGFWVNICSQTFVREIIFLTVCSDYFLVSFSAFSEPVLDMGNYDRMRESLSIKMSK